MGTFDTNEGQAFGIMVDRAGDRVLVALSGEFALEAAKRFEDAVEELERETVRELTLDLGGITFMDTTGAFLLVDAHRRFSGRARVTFEGATPTVQRLFESVGMGSLLSMPHGVSDPPGGHIPGPEQDVATPGHPHHPHLGVGPRHELNPRRRP